MKRVSKIISIISILVFLAAFVPTAAFCAPVNPTGAGTAGMAGGTNLMAGLGSGTVGAAMAVTASATALIVAIGSDKGTPTHHSSSHHSSPSHH